MKMTLFCTICYGAFSSDVNCRFQIAYDGDTLALDHLCCFLGAHLGVVHGVDHLAIKCFWTFALRECGYVGYTTEPPNAENDKVCLVYLEKKGKEIRGCRNSLL